jgi:hypothetical protein
MACDVRSAGMPPSHSRSRLTAPVSHQKWSCQSATSATEFRQNPKKINEADSYTPLITVWLRVRVLPDSK